MGLSEEQVNAILDGHRESLDHYHAEADKYKAESEESKKQLEKVQKELKTIKDEAEKSEGKNPYKVKYEAIKEEFESYKNDISAKETKATKEAAFKKLLKECGVSDKLINSVAKVSDIDGIELDENGKIKDEGTLKKSIKDEWSDFIPTEGMKGAETSTPPANNGGKLTREEIIKIKDDTERQNAWAQYLSQNQ